MANNPKDRIPGDFAHSATGKQSRRYGHALATCGLATEFHEMVIADYKFKRNRQSDPKTILRNIEICDLRKQNWSEGRLGRHFDVSPAYIRKVLRDEKKWRRQYAALPPSEPNC